MPTDLTLVAGLDLARRRDHSALVLLAVEPERLTVTAALRLPQAPLRQQFGLIAPHLAGLDLLVFDQSGLGDAAAELLPKTPHVGVCLVGSDRPPARSASGDRLVVGKQVLIQRLGMAMRSGALTGAEKAPGRDLLRQEPCAVRLQARRARPAILVSLGSLDEPARVKPVNQYGIESRLPAFFELADLPGETTEQSTPAEWLPKLISHQHPDQD